MAKIKTTRNTKSVTAFLNDVQDETQRKDALTILQMMKRVTGEEPAMWGPGIVGFGSYHYVYESGREGDWPLTGFSPRKQSLTIYIMDGFPKYESFLRKLGKHSTGKSCLYVKRLVDIDMTVLEKLISESILHVKKKHVRKNG